MVKRIEFGSEEEDGYPLDGEISEGSEDLHEAESKDDLNEEDDLDVEEQSAAPVHFKSDDSDDDDEAPEEVSVSSSKAHMMDIYKIQKEAAVATRKRKRKQRNIKVEEELDEEMLELLANNPASLTADSILVKEEELPNKRINLEREVPDPTRKVEKNVEGFKLVALPKSANAVGKKINSSVLDFQQRHFYGKGSNRVSASSFMNHKKGKPTRR